jgi:hypothetical protein
MRATIFLATLTWPVFAQNQPPKTIADSVLGPLRMVEGQLLGVAEAVPESKYSFIPTSGKFEGVRSFGEQINTSHAASSHSSMSSKGKRRPPTAKRAVHRRRRPRPN